MSSNYLNPNFNSQYPHLQNGEYPVPSKGGIDSIKQQENLVGTVADRVDPNSGLMDTAKMGAMFGIPLSMACVRGTNWLMQPKVINDAMTQLEAYQQSRLYKIGAKLDNSSVGRWVNNSASAISRTLRRIPVPKTLKDMWGKIKIGTISTWDSSGMYTQGKSAEAMQEVMTFFSETFINEKGVFDIERLRKLGLDSAKETQLKNLLETFKAGKINQVEGFKILDTIIKKVSAKKLIEISPNPGRLGRLLDVTRNLNLSVSKARFFAGAAASGFLGKTFNKVVSLLGEATGGAVLGGKSVLFMNAFAISSAFVAAKNAEKGDKLKAFMEDYWGTTVFGYLGLMLEGFMLHKGLGIAEHGMRLENCLKPVTALGNKTVAEALGKKSAVRVQDLVIEYNKEFLKYKPVNKILDALNSGGNISLSKVNSILERFGKSKVSDLASAKNALSEIVGNNTTSFFKTLRNEIANATKSNVSFGSIFKSKSIRQAGHNFLEWFTKKPLASVAKLFATGKYTMFKDGNFWGNMFRSLKRRGGGFARIAFILFVVGNIARNMGFKFSHGIFGKPKKSQLDEEMKSKTTQGENVPNSNNQIPQNNVPQERSSQNLVDLYMQNMPKKEIAKNPHPNALKSDTATYVPNQILGQESYVDPAITKEFLERRDMVLAKADVAEKNAQELLKKL